MLARALGTVLCWVVVACSADALPAVSHAPMRPLYSYSLISPTEEVRAGDTQLLTWAAIQPGRSDTGRATAKLCFGVFGAFSDVSALKSSTQPRPMCPMTASGALFASDVVEVDLFAGNAVTQELRLPHDAQPGLYNFVQITDWGGGNYVSAAGIIKVVAAR